MESLNNMCRICLQPEDTLFSLFSKRKGLSPYDKLVSKTSIKIQYDDTGPASICFQCLRELDITVAFLEKCEKSNEILAANMGKAIEVSSAEISEMDCRIGESDAEIVDEVNEPSLAPASGGEAHCEECGSQGSCRHQVPSALQAPAAKDARHVCQYCQKVFSRKYNYTLHVKRHRGERDFPCPSCGIPQLTAGAARRHCVPRPRRACARCGKAYTTRANLATHMRTHDGERPFVCSECGKGFTCKTTLNVHVRIHTGVKPYICPICGKRFTTNKLSTHMLSHSNAKPYKCSVPLCTRKFSSPSGLRAHAASHVTARAHGCGRCAARYRHRQSLRKHLRSAHAAML